MNTHFFEIRHRTRKARDAVIATLPLEDRGWAHEQLDSLVEDAQLAGEIPSLNEVLKLIYERLTLQRNDVLNQASLLNLTLFETHRL